MKSIPLIALLVSALCTAGAITAYMLVGRTEPDQSFRPQLRRRAAVVAEGVEITSPRVHSPSIPQPAHSTHTASRSRLEAPRSEEKIVTPFVEDSRETFFANSTALSDTPIRADSGQQFGAQPGMMNHQFGRSSSSPISPKFSKLPTFKETAQPLRKNLPTSPSTEHSQVGDTPARTNDLSPPEPTAPEATAHPNRTSVPAKQRPPSPRPFTVEQERLRAQIGWQAFADAVFESSLNPQENTGQ